ncbi:MAG TPA: DUF2147 domain-containing protein [Xanthobacteraceae bacterium]|nr:DUF2147 domain-containing protein [Xanthobacteraceae bacterium]
MIRALCALTLFSSLPAAASAQTAMPAGTWLNEDKDGMVEIADCGRLRGQPETGLLCGHVVWIRDAVDRTTGRPPVDAKNVDPKLRGRPILGLPVVLDMRPSAASGRWDGRIYNIDDGKTYTGKLTALPDGRLRVEGCVMLVCQGETWTRQASPATPAARSPASAHDRAR